jgi:hypothetical protein
MGIPMQTPYHVWESIKEQEGGSLPVDVAAYMIVEAVEHSVALHWGILGREERFRDAVPIGTLHDIEDYANRLRECVARVALVAAPVLLEHMQEFASAGGRPEASWGRMAEIYGLVLAEIHKHEASWRVSR